MSENNEENVDKMENKAQQVESEVSKEEIIASLETVTEETKEIEVTKVKTKETKEIEVTEEKTKETKVTEEIEVTKSTIDSEVTEVIEKIEESIAIDAEKETPKEIAVPVVDYSKLSLEELVEELKKTLSNNPVQKVKNQVEAIKTAFNQSFGALLADKKAAFLEAGGDSIDFQFSSPIKTEYNLLLSDYKKYKFILLCDDLSFDAGENTYKSLKAALDGGIEGKPSNVIFYATSNRRHLMPRDMMENEQSTAINPSESVEEKVSLSDRFGLWIGFHNMSQDVYLEIVFAYCKEFNISLEQNILRSQALEWSITRGARSGRVAWQFIQDIASKQKVKIN
mgnify:CR=1 FL=1